MSAYPNLVLDSADLDLERRVRDFLDGRRVASLRRLEVEARAGTVTLRGRVTSFYEKQLSGLCCRHVPGVLDLIDRVEVTPPAARPKAALCAALLLAALPMLGCGKGEARVPVYPVQGRVSFDGWALPGAFVVLHPLGGRAAAVPPARGAVDAAGTFALTTYAPNDGAPAGEYAVTVQWQRVVGSGDDAQATPNLLPPKYADPRSTDLRVRVAEGANELPPLVLRR